MIGFIPFPRVLVLCEMQSVSSMIWTEDIYVTAFKVNAICSSPRQDEVWHKAFLGCDPGTDWSAYDQQRQNYLTPSAFSWWDTSGTKQAKTRRTAPWGQGFIDSNKPPGIQSWRDLSDMPPCGVWHKAVLWWELGMNQDLCSAGKKIIVPVGIPLIYSKQ